MGKTGRLAITCLCISLLAGCAIGPNYKRPQVETPAAWRIEETDAHDLADTAWWEQFNDPVLTDLIGLALKNNKDVRIAAAKVEEFVGRYGVTRASLFPQAGASVNTIRRGVTVFSNPPLPATEQNPFSDYQAFSYASWELDIWGRLRRATEAARADLLSTEEARRGVILTLVSTVASTYTDLRDLDRQLEIARGTVKSRAEALQLFQLRFDRGLISELELRQAESELQSALATVPSLEKQIGQEENALSFLLGRNPGAIPRGKSIDELALPDIPSGLPSSLLERRPDIRKAEQDLIAANARIGIAKALYFPSIFLTGTYGVESVDLSRLFTGPAKTWNYTTPVNMPIFTAGAIAGSVKVAQAVREQTLLKYQQVIQGAFTEVENALIDQTKSREQLKVQRQQVEALRSYAELATLRYENGYTSYIEVLDAERGLFNAELAYAQTKGNVFRAMVNMYKSMGGGWVLQAENLAGN